jgi:hypothetical protein
LACILYYKLENKSKVKIKENWIEGSGPNHGTEEQQPLIKTKKTSHNNAYYLREPPS